MNYQQKTSNKITQRTKGFYREMIIACNEKQSEAYKKKLGRLSHNIDFLNSVLSRGDVVEEIWVNDRLAAGAIVYYGDEKYTGRCLNYIYVRPKYRGNGFGKLLAKGTTSICVLPEDVETTRMPELLGWDKDKLKYFTTPSTGTDIFISNVL